jgi:hypothetical protein
VGGVGSGNGETMSEKSPFEARRQERATAKPPETAERLLLCLLPDPVRDNVSGDLSEIFSAIIVPSCGISRARLWYWRQVICSMRLFFEFRKNPQAALEFWKGGIHMYKPMHNAATYHPGISMHHISVGSDVPGLLFVFATLFIFGVGIPAFLVLLLISGTLGLLASRVILNWHKHHTLEIQTLNLHKLK